MMRIVYYWVSVLSLLLVIGIYFFRPPIIYALWIVIPYILLGIRDLRGTHNILRNYPVIGHLRYMFEFIRPEIQQYFVATNQSGRPFNRELRSLVYERAQKEGDTLPFGTQRDITAVGYELAYHSLAPTTVNKEKTRIMVGDDQCKKPYHASRINISAMSFGALSSTAILSLNKGAKLGNFGHNTGEGGLSQYHLAGGGDIFWQLGTAYFGCRLPDGRFDSVLFEKKSNFDNVKMIEIKLSQGAKPSHGGILPGAKVDAEIAEIRGVEIGKDCISPPKHPEFDTPEELCHFIARLRELSGGKPIGFKLCIGIRHEFMAICKAMLKTGIIPDFITVDGAEGGTGAAPLEFSNRLGTPINEALLFVHSCLLGINLRDKIRIISSAKVTTGFDVVTKLALGADMCNIARSMMFSLGCIQALKCNTNLCPTGVTTQDKRRAKAIDVERKHIRVANYHEMTMDSFLDITGALGYDDPDKLTPDIIYRRVSDETTKNFSKIYAYLKPGELLGKDIHTDYADDWRKAKAESF